MFVTSAQDAVLSLSGELVVSWAGNLDALVSGIESVSLMAVGLDTSVGSQGPSFLAVLLDAFFFVLGRNKSALATLDADLSSIEHLHAVSWRALLSDAVLTDDNVVLVADDLLALTGRIQFESVLASLGNAVNSDKFLSDSAFEGDTGITLSDFSLLASL